jgi:hypothetical protein
MSAIWMKCKNCGGQYITGMVGMTPWPAHVCSDGTENADAEFTTPRFSSIGPEPDIDLSGLGKPHPIKRKKKRV